MTHFKLKEERDRAMNIYDAAKVLGITGDITPEDVKAAYRAACKKYHPDVNPVGDDMMKLINAAYAVLKDYTGTVKDQQTDYGDALNAALNGIFGLPGLVIEICGAWLWVTGTTATHREQLKAAGFKWAPKKKAWYFRPEEYRSKGRGKASLEEIRAKYGSSRPAPSGRNQLEARA
jgi:hypothetical protein